MNHPAGMVVIAVDAREFETAHPDHLLFPDAAITKRDRARYRARIAPSIDSSSCLAPGTIG
jgi:DNA primase